MAPLHRYAVEWPAPDGALRLFEPSPEEVEAVADALAAFYNDPHNRAMMAHTGEMSREDVVSHFRGLREAGGRPLLLERDGALMGDADLRHLDGRAAEFAIMIGARAAQGKGLGLRFALMAHALAFEALGLEQVFVTIIPANRASQRLFQKLGYLPDDSPQARAYAEAPDDLSLSLGRERFRELHAATLRELRVVEGTP